MVHKILNEAQSILVVEDSDDDFDATKRAFGKANLRNPIVHAISGEEVLFYLDGVGTEFTGLILLDLNMPGMDGRQTLKAIKQNPRFKKIPIIVLTTSDDERDIKVCYEFGANTYIQKPVDFDGLIEAIQRLKEYWFEIALLPKNDTHE